MNPWDQYGNWQTGNLPGAVPPGQDGTAIDAVGGPGWGDWLADQWRNFTGTAGTGKTPNTLTEGVRELSPLLIAVAVGAAVFVAGRALR